MAMLNNLGNERNFERPGSDVCSSGSIPLGTLFYATPKPLLEVINRVRQVRGHQEG